MTVRRATAADAAGVRAIYAPFVRDTHVSFEEAVPAEPEVARRIAAAGPAHPWLVADAVSARLAEAGRALGEGRG